MRVSPAMSAEWTGLGLALDQSLVEPHRVWRAVDRGDLTGEVDKDFLIDLLSSPDFYRIFITGHRVEPDLAEKLVDFVLLRHIPRKATTQV
jgi:hypothetical protein